MIREYVPAEEFRRKSQHLDRCCEEIGRPPGVIERSAQLIIRADHPAEPAASRAMLGELIEVGVSHSVLAPVPGGRPLEWLADEAIGPILTPTGV